MIHELRLPGMPRTGLTEVSCNVRLWEDDTLSGFITLSNGASTDELDALVHECSHEATKESRQQIVSGLLMMTHYVILRLMNDPTCDEYTALEEGRMLYAHMI
jgi:hypothetical protein